MDNLIDFNSSPVSKTSSEKLSMLIPSKLFPDEGTSSPDGLLQHDIFKKDLCEVNNPKSLLTDPFESQILGTLNSTSSVIGNLLSFEYDLPENDTTSFESYRIYSNSNGIKNSGCDEFNFNEEIAELIDVPANQSKKDLGASSFNNWYGSVNSNDLNKQHSSLIFKENVEKLVDLNEIAFNTVSENFESDSDNSTPNSNKSISNSDKNSSRSKCGKTGVKNKLLKLSFSNALIQSPISRRSSLESNISPDTSIFTEAAKLAKHLSQTYLSSPNSSPIKHADDSCDDLMEINPKWIDSESDISKDLELMRIPMLDKICDHVFKDHEIVEENKQIIEDTNYDSRDFIKTHNEKKLIAIQSIKERVKHKQNSNSYKPCEEIDSLISDLKDFVIQCNTDCTKKNEAQKLLDSLSSLLKSKEVENNETSNIKEVNENLRESKPPKPITRQGTFDIDLEKDDKIKNSDNGNNSSSNASNEEQQKAETELSIHSQLHSTIKINDMVEEIGKILGGTEKVNVLQTSLQNCKSSNPTVIVVMGTPSKHFLNCNNDENIASPDQKQFRRRSCSLTLPEKNLRLNSNDGISSKAKEIAKPLKGCNSFKTPNRNYLSRRNSISSSTPHHNASISLTARRSIYGNNNSNIKPAVRPTVITSTQNKFETNANESHRNRPKKSVLHLKTDTNSKRFRLKSGGRESTQSKGPIKATLRMNTVVSTLHSDSSTPTQNYDIRRKSMLDSNSFSFGNRNPVIKNLPIACSTPVFISPRKSSNNRSNHLRLPTTPNAKSHSNFLNVSGGFANRRKSFSDSSTVVGKVTKTANASPNMKISQEAPKIINRLKLPSIRIQSALLKENKNPKK